MTLSWLGAKEVVSVEHNRGWHEKIAALAPSFRVILAPIDRDDSSPGVSNSSGDAEAIDAAFTS